jgi:PAS domain S-box-containing protein
MLDRGMAVDRHDDGKPLRLIGTNTDITNRKQSEQKIKETEKNLRKIIELSPTPLYLNDTQGNITYLNKAFTDTIGYTISDVPTLDAWWPRAYPDPNYKQWVADTWQKSLEEASKSGMPFSPLELNIQCKNNSIRTFIAGAASLDAGLSGTHLVTLHDITERKQAELLLTKSEKQYRLIAEWEAHQRLEQGRFLAMLTHELKNPLAAINFAIANLNGDKNSNLNSLQHISLAVRDIDAIIDHCVQADHVGSGHHQINISRFFIAQLFNEITHSLNSITRLKVDISNSLSISSDKILFRTILINLIDNALKYSPPDSEVSVSVIQKHSNTNQLGILVSVCNKVGIAGRPDKAKIFVKYYRSSSAQRQRGTGLGLWLVKGIAVQLGGQIKYISHQDKLEFQVWIPQL